MNKTVLVTSKVQREGSKLTELIASWRVGLDFLVDELPKRRFIVGGRSQGAATKQKAYVYTYKEFCSNIITLHLQTDLI